ncbi:hypothetical protein A2783_05195 [Microgenomates group bacterium RIFCSPHIGHO2_01_FULL_45_11]|nr:MAG: hypothetical protein A2783_05195 [Microgenomates group bacterium RIFCSPHIGHO2_01_FULL_45_11]
MALPQDFSQLKEALAKANDIYMLIAENPNPDTVAGALALYLSLKEVGKNVLVGCQSPMRVEFSRLVGVDKVTTKIGSRNLVISFDYYQDSIDKVSYHVEGKMFNLMVQPKTGAKPLNPANVKYSYSGAAADMVFIVGATTLDNLGDLYRLERKLFDEAYTVGVSRFQVAAYAQTMVTDPQASSVSEVVFQLVKALELSVSGDSASNLLFGIEYATQSFSAATTSATVFEAVAELLKAGGRRQFPAVTVGEKKAVVGEPSQVRVTEPAADRGVMKPMTPAMSAKNPPQGVTTQNQSDDKPPEEWLQPKIFRGSTKV